MNYEVMTSAIADRVKEVANKKIIELVLAFIDNPAKQREMDDDVHQLLILKMVSEDKGEWETIKKRMREKYK